MALTGLSMSVLDEKLLLRLLVVSGSGSTSYGSQPDSFTCYEGSFVQAFSKYDIVIPDSDFRVMDGSLDVFSVRFTRSCVILGCLTYFSNIFTAPSLVPSGCPLVRIGKIHGSYTVPTVVSFYY